MVSKRINWEKSYGKYVERYRTDESRGYALYPMLSKTEYKDMYTELVDAGVATANEKKNMPRFIQNEVSRKVSSGTVVAARLARKEARSMIGANGGQATELEAQILKMGGGTAELMKYGNEYMASLREYFGAQVLEDILYG